jgi:diguanylate cyclase
MTVLHSAPATAQLQHLGVDAAQGNFFHPPMTGEKLLTLLLDNTTTY